MLNIFKTIPERHRWKIYVSGLVVFGLVIVGLLVIDVWRGGDAGEWIKWVAGIAGLGVTGLAVSNTDRYGDDV